MRSSFLHLISGQLYGCLYIASAGGGDGKEEMCVAAKILFLYTRRPKLLKIDT